MKKIILMLISVMMLMPLMADAQIKKTGSRKSETIASTRMGFLTLKLDEGGYFLAMQTTNQFDDLMILKLGATKKSAVQSLNDLIDVLDSLQGEETQYIDNGYGREFRLYKSMVSLHIYADGYAGSSNVAKSELKKFIKAINGEKEEKKTNERFPDPLY